MDVTKIPPEKLGVLPAMKPPSGYTSNFANPSIDGSNDTQTIATMGFLTALTVVILLLRLYTKVFVLRKTGWDDYTAVGATIGAVAYASMVIYVFSNGFGVHQWNVTVKTLFDLTDYMNAILYMYKPFMLLAKLSLCVFFYNIFGKDTKMRWAIYFAVAYNVVLQITAFFLSIFLCIPGRPEFWQCSHKISVLNVVTAGFNIFSDFYLLVLPLFAISQLQMHTRRKVGVLVVFTVGILACVASILGLVYRIRQNSSPDVTWNFAPEIILVTFELEATIIVGCILVLPALFRSQHPLSFGSFWSHRSRLLKTSSSRSSDAQTLRSNSSGRTPIRSSFSKPSFATVEKWETRTPSDHESEV